MERTDRIEEEIKKVVSKLIDQELKDPRLTGLISVTKAYIRNRTIRRDLQKSD